MYLEQMKTTDFKSDEKYTFVIPMGATEQHGPFLPLGTDSFIQDKIIELAETSLPNVIFLPTLRITCSKEHQGFPGSVWIEKDAMELILKNICESLAPQAKNIAIVSWHGGNISTVNRFVEKYKTSFRPLRLEYIQMDSEETLEKTRALLRGGPVDEHAGNSEISMMLACDKALVSVPPKDYPKQTIENAWDTDRLVDVSKDGIIDNHPDWIIDNNIGQRCLLMAAQELKEGIEKMLHADVQR